jgi:hypothetical protein
LQVKRYAAGLAIAAFVIAVIAWRVQHAPDPARAAAPASPVVVSPAPVHAQSPSAAPVLPARGVAPYPELGEAGLAKDDPLTAYRRANVYPPTSRPLSAEHRDLLRPNERHEQPRPTDADDGVAFVLTADRYFVVGDEAVTVTLDVRREGAPLPVTITQAFAAQADHRLPDPPRTPLQLRGKGPLTATFQPATLGLRAQATIGLYVEFATPTSTSARTSISRTRRRPRCPRASPARFAMRSRPARSSCTRVSR